MTNNKVVDLCKREHLTSCFTARLWELTEKTFGKSPSSKEGQKPIYKALGISQSKVSSWFHGKLPEADQIVNVSRLFGVSVYYLLGLTDERTEKLSPPPPEPSHLPVPLHPMSSRIRYLYTLSALSDQIDEKLLVTKGDDWHEAVVMNGFISLPVTEPFCDFTGPRMICLKIDRHVQMIPRVKKDDLVLIDVLDREPVEPNIYLVWCGGELKIRYVSRLQEREGWALLARAHQMEYPPDKCFLKNVEHKYNPVLGRVIAITRTLSTEEEKENSYGE